MPRFLVRWYADQDMPETIGETAATLSEHQLYKQYIAAHQDVFTQKGIVRSTALPPAPPVEPVAKPERTVKPRVAKVTERKLS